MSMFTRDDLLNDQGRYKTRGLFKEVCRPEDEPIFTWSKSSDKEGLINLRDLYLLYSVDDPSEATFAEVVCEDLGWWEEVKTSKWMKDQLNEWRKVATVKRKAKAFKAIIKEIEEGGRSSFTAAKYLIEEPWIDKRTKGAREASQETTEKAHESVSGDLVRLQDYLQERQNG